MTTVFATAKDFNVVYCVDGSHECHQSAFFPL